MAASFTGGFSLGVTVNETNSVFALVHTWFLPSAPANHSSVRLSRNWHFGAPRNVSGVGCSLTEGACPSTPPRATHYSADGHTVAATYQGLISTSGSYDATVNSADSAPNSSGKAYSDSCCSTVQHDEAVIDGAASTTGVVGCEAGQRGCSSLDQPLTARSNISTAVCGGDGQQASGATCALAAFLGAGDSPGPGDDAEQPDAVACRAPSVHQAPDILTLPADLTLPSPSSCRQAPPPSPAVVLPWTQPWFVSIPSPVTPGSDVLPGMSPSQATSSPFLPLPPPLVPQLPETARFHPSSACATPQSGTTGCSKVQPRPQLPLGETPRGDASPAPTFSCLPIADIGRDSDTLSLADSALDSVAPSEPANPSTAAHAAPYAFRARVAAPEVLAYAEDSCSEGLGSDGAAERRQRSPTFGGAWGHQPGSPCGACEQRQDAPQCAGNACPQSGLEQRPMSRSGSYDTQSNPASSSLPATCRDGQSGQSPAGPLHQQLAQWSALHAQLAQEYERLGASQEVSQARCSELEAALAAKAGALADSEAALRELVERCEALATANRALAAEVRAGGGHASEAPPPAPSHVPLGFATPSRCGSGPRNRQLERCSGGGGASERPASPWDRAPGGRLSVSARCSSEGSGVAAPPTQRSMGNGCHTGRQNPVRSSTAGGRYDAGSATTPQRSGSTGSGFRHHGRQATRAQATHPHPEQAPAHDLPPRGKPAMSPYKGSTGDGPSGSKASGGIIAWTGDECITAWRAHNPSMQTGVDDSARAGSAMGRFRPAPSPVAASSARHPPGRGANPVTPQSGGTMAEGSSGPYSMIPRPPGLGSR